MAAGFDERCAADLSNVVEGRALAREDAAWLARAVTGAVRPNRDKPFWDLAHALAALARRPGIAGGRDLLDLVLDPRLARPAALAARIGPAGPGADERGLVLPLGETVWRTTWGGAARTLALAEFVATAEDLAGFAELAGWLDELVRSADDGAATGLLVRRLVRSAAAYRQRHLPLAPVEKRFRAILSFLAGRPSAARGHGFDEDDILDYWRAELAGGERVGFRTVAEHFVTYEGVASALGGLAGLSRAASLEAIEGWEDRLDATLGEVVGEDAAAPLAAALAGLGDGPKTMGPKILTGAERDDLVDMLRLEPFHRSRPLTVLRAISFGRVQSGIANRLRRGSGGADIAERTGCAEAEPYADLDARARELQAHLDRMVRIAAALRIDASTADERVAAALAAAEAEIRRVRRAGFEDRARLADAFSQVDEVLVRAAREVASFVGAVEKLAGSRPLTHRFEADRAVFADALTRAYAEEFA